MHTIITRHDITEILLKVALNTINHHFLHFTLLFVMKYVLKKPRWNEIIYSALYLQCECDWIFHWQHKLCATFSAGVNINYRLSIKVCYRIYTLRHIRIEINHGSQNVFWVLTWIGGFYPEPENYSMIYFLNLTFRC